MLAVSTVCLGISILGLFTGGQFSSGNSNDSSLEAAHAGKLINAELTKGKAIGQPERSTFLVIFKSGSLQVAEAAYQTALEAAVAPLASDARVTRVSTPYNQGAAVVPNLVSRD